MPELCDDASVVLYLFADMLRRVGNRADIAAGAVCRRGSTTAPSGADSEQASMNLSGLALWGLVEILKDSGIDLPAGRQVTHLAQVRATAE